MDVVPVIPGTEEIWEHPPFGGVIADGQIWGRGSLDDKSTVMAVLEAVELLVSSGFQPRRTIYLAFGHDEEVGGPEGAHRIAETLAARGIDSFAFILDEGGFIGEGIASGIDGKVAVVGIAEKGFVSLELVVEGEGGHSSAPPDHTALGILSKAVTRLEENPFPARLEGTTREMLGFLAPEMPFVAKMVLGNLWLTRPLVGRLMLADPSTAAMLRTTTAVTIMEGGVKENVLPIEARAVVNHRIIPGETVESVTRRVQEIVDDDRVRVSPLGWSGEPSPVSDPSSQAFELIGRTLLEVAPDEAITVTPYLVIGGTDAKYYSGRSDNVFRFLPVIGGPDVLEMVHGTNERIAIDSLELAVRYFVQLLRNSEELT
jgi:carboxypeptidase PM20D1